MNILWITSFSILFVQIFGFGHFGTLFYLSLPDLQWVDRYDSGVMLFFSKIVRDSVEIEFTTPHFKSENKSAKVVIAISKGQMKTFRMSNTFLHPVTKDMKTKYCFKFVSEQNFAISVLLKLSDSRMDTFQLIPLKTWGKLYYIFTLRSYDTIMVVAPVADNLVTVRATVASVRVLRGISNSPEVLDFETSPTPSIVWKVAENDTFLSISGCSSMDYGSTSLSGTKVFARLPVGVITGSCFVNFTTFKCQNETESKSLLDGDLTQEMILPAYTYAKHFIVFYTSARKSPAMVAVQATVEKTNVRRYTGAKWTSKMQIYNLDNPGDIIEIKDVTHACLIKSSHPVQVFYIQTPICGNEMLGDISLVTILPTSLFYNLYYWGVDLHLDVQYSAIVIARSWTIFDLLLNDHPMYDRITVEGHKLRDVYGSGNWKVFEISLTHEYNSLSGDERNLFGCYLYGVGKEAGTSQFVGFYKDEPCMQMNSASGDLVDNDCDYEINEEELNGIDDDNDSSIDEDVAILLKGPYYSDTEIIISEDEPYTRSLVFDTILWLMSCVVATVMLAAMVGHRRSERMLGFF